jgi:hypothetical protein
MNDNKIIGFNLSLNFGFGTDQDDKKEIINKIENMIDDLFKDKHDTGAILLGGEAEFIKEYNNLGIKKI